jgi:hypothetical protein
MKPVLGGCGKNDIPQLRLLKGRKAIQDDEWMELQTVALGL